MNFDILLNGEGDGLRGKLVYDFFVDFAANIIEWNCLPVSISVCHQQNTYFQLMDYLDWLVVLLFVVTVVMVIGRLRPAKIILNYFKFIAKFYFQIRRISIGIFHSSWILLNLEIWFNEENEKFIFLYWEVH